MDDARSGRAARLIFMQLPAPLLARGLTLGMIDRETVRRLLEQAGPEQMRQRVAWLGAVLGAGNLETEERDRLEIQALRLAEEVLTRDQRSGLETMAEFVPQLGVERQARAKAVVRPMLESQRQPGDHRLWRVLAPDDYPAWLRSIVALYGRRWSGLTLNSFLERLSILPDLDDAERRSVLESALASVGSVQDPSVTLDAEEGIGGIPKYTPEQVEKAQTAAQTAAVRVLGPLLPPDLRERALAQGLEPRASLRWTPVELLRARWGSFRWVRHQLDEVSRLAWIASELSLADRALLSQKLAARLAELIPLAAHGVAAARDALRPLIDIALPPLAPALSPAQTETLLAHYGFAAASPRMPGAPARRMLAALFPPPLLAPALAFGLIDDTLALGYAASAPNRPPSTISSWIDYPCPTLRVDLQIAILTGASLAEDRRVTVEAQTLEAARRDIQTGPISRAFLLAHLRGEQRAAVLDELRAELSPRPWPGMGPAARENWLGSLWWNRFDLLRLLAPSLPADLLHACLDRQLARYPPASQEDCPEEMFRARLALLPYLQGAALRQCLEAALNAAVRAGPRSPGKDDRAESRAAALASLGPYLPADLRAVARQEIERDGEVAPPHLDWSLDDLEEAMRANFLSPRCPQPWSNPHWIAPYSLPWSRWQDTLPTWRRIAALLTAMQAAERGHALADLCDRFAALAQAFALELSIHPAYWQLVTVGLRAAAPFLSQDQVAALLALFERSRGS